MQAGGPQGRKGQAGPSLGGRQRLLVALPSRPREPSPGLQTMGPTPAAALGTRSAHPDAPGFSRGQGGEAPAGMLPQPRTPAAPPRGDAAQPWGAAGVGCGNFPAGRGPLRPSRVPFNCSLSSKQAAGSFSCLAGFSRQALAAAAQTRSSTARETGLLRFFGQQTPFCI